MILFLVNAIINRNAFDLRVDLESEEKIMTIEREQMRMAYGNFIEVLTMTTHKLLRSNLKIYRPFNQFRERLRSCGLSKTSLSLNQRVTFMTWCSDYTETVLDEIQQVIGDTKLVDRDSYWEVSIPSKMATAEQSEMLNTIAHFCGSPMWKGIDFGEVDSPLKFDDFIKNFDDDDWDALRSQLERYTLRIWEDIYHNIDNVLQVCNKLDSRGKSEQTFEDCKNRVFGE